MGSVPGIWDHDLSLSYKQEPDRHSTDWTTQPTPHQAQLFNSISNTLTPFSVIHFSIRENGYFLNDRNFIPLFTYPQNLESLLISVFLVGFTFNSLANHINASSISVIMWPLLSFPSCHPAASHHFSPELCNLNTPVTVILLKWSKALSPSKIYTITCVFLFM